MVHVFLLMLRTANCFTIFGWLLSLFKNPSSKQRHFSQEKTFSSSKCFDIKTFLMLFFHFTISCLDLAYQILLLKFIFVFSVIPYIYMYLWLTCFAMRLWCAIGNRDPMVNDNFPSVQWSSKSKVTFLPRPKNILLVKEKFSWNLDTKLHNKSGKVSVL